MSTFTTRMRRAAFTAEPDQFLAVLDRFLQVLHERGIVNETALFEVLEVLALGMPLSRDHLVGIFGVQAIYHLMTTKDETARALVCEAADLLGNPESRVNPREWFQAAERIVGPITPATIGRAATRGDPCSD